MKLLRAAVVLASVMTIAGCSGSGNANAPSETNLSGNWSGTFTPVVTPTVVAATVTMTLTQSGDAVSGTAATLAPDASPVPGTVSGTLSNGQFQVSIARTDGVCTTSGVLTVTGNQMNGALTGGDCLPGTWAVTKQ